MSAGIFSFIPPGEASKPYTVSEINEGVCSIIEAGNTLVWVEAEISNFKQASSGHCYLKLKDEQSQIPAVIWKTTAQGLPFLPEDGMQIVAIASLRVYTRGGYYQLDLHKVQPSGRGALFAAFERLKKKLEAEGLFDPARKRPLPPHVARLGVITSKRGAALSDIIKVARSRSRSVDIVVLDVPVQGEKAGGAIAQAIRDMNAYGKVDCIIVGRGGGSIEDLWAFNEEVVARAIYQSGLPVISAVGHEVDFTIADFVADVRAPTPSAAAQIAVADDEQNRRYYTARAQHLVRRVTKYFSHLRATFDAFKSGRALRRVIRMVHDGRQATDELRRRSQAAMTHSLRHARQRFAGTAGELSALSPLTTMARGFSVVTREDGTLVRDSGRVSPNEKVNIRFFKGAARAEIIGVDGTEQQWKRGGKK
jgi:exodeoxyribonuclease VII large subunit